MNLSRTIKFIAAMLLFSVIFCAECLAAPAVTEKSQSETEKLGPADDRFPFFIVTDAEDSDKLCYAGHMAGGGIFYDDGKLILPTSQFRIVSLAADENKIAELAVEITLLYENSHNSGCTREIIRKYPAGSFRTGSLYGFFSDSAVKNLTQRKKLYSSDLSSVRVTLTLGDRSKTSLFFVANEADYAAALKKQ